MLYFFDMDADDSPLTTSVSILYFSVIVLNLRFLLQPEPSKSYLYNKKSYLDENNKILDS